MKNITCLTSTRSTGPTWLIICGLYRFHVYDFPTQLATVMVHNIIFNTKLKNLDLYIAIPCSLTDSTFNFT